MRIWSIHPEHLDAKGLVALWRETLLAKHVLLGKTKGYKNHPQLERFKKHDSSVKAINYYLYFVYEEAGRRGYKFDTKKIGKVEKDIEKISVTDGQVEFEWQHLKRKLKIRDPKMLSANRQYEFPKLHPIFYLTEGELESWEKI